MYAVCSYNAVCVQTVYWIQLYLKLLIICQTFTSNTVHAKHVFSLIFLLCTAVTPVRHVEWCASYTFQSQKQELLDTGCFLEHNIYSYWTDQDSSCYINPEE